MAQNLRTVGLHRMTTSSLSRAVLLLPILSFAAAAQTPPLSWENVKMLAPGTPIQVAAGTSKPIVATLESVTDSELVISSANGPQTFPRPQIMRVSVPKKSRRLRNAMIGLGVGTAAGIAAGFGYGYCSEQGNWCHLDEGIDSAIGGGIGLVVGTAVGLLWPTGGWRKIYAP
jgi:hypothetical protein